MAKPESPELASLRSRLKDQWGDDPDSAQRADQAIAVFASWWAELRVGRSQFLSAVQAHRSERRRIYSQLMSRLRDKRVDWRAEFERAKAELDHAQVELERAHDELDRAYEEIDRSIGWKGDDV